jgi:hypothetical protein
LMTSGVSFSDLTTSYMSTPFPATGQKHRPTMLERGSSACRRCIPKTIFSLVVDTIINSAISEACGRIQVDNWMMFEFQVCRLKN